ATAPRRRGSPPPLVACAPSAVANATGTTRSTTAESDAAPAVRATSSRWGGRTHATSAPLENITCPLHHANCSLARYAPTGPKCSGGGAPSSPPPPPPPTDDRPACVAS